MLRVKEGDQKAFEELFEQFRAPILSFLFHFVRDRDRAEDLCQEVFLKVYRTRQTYEPTAKFSTWLWTIARNSAIDEVRRKGEVQAYSVVNEEGQESSPMDLLESPAPSAETQLLEHAERARLEGCIGKLPANQQEALLMRTQSELSYEEVADAIGLSASAVKSLLHRAKNALVECLRRGERIG